MWGVFVIMLGVALGAVLVARTVLAQNPRAMVIPHAAELNRMPSFAANAEPVPGGVRLTVTAKPPSCG